MQSEVKRCIRVMLYMPAYTANAKWIHDLWIAWAGGYTRHPNAWGLWREAGKEHSEPVCVLEVLVTGHSLAVWLGRIDDFGREFLREFPQEQCFMAYVGGRMLTITRDKE